jgi:hypothetical protein
MDISDISKFLQQAGAKPGLFSITSRYKDIAMASLEGNDEPLVYIRRRFLPQPENFSLLQVYTVKEGDRVDNVANQFLGDPEKFWQLCDANNIMHPEELTETPGAEIKITLPEGIPGYNNA